MIVHSMTEKEVEKEVLADMLNAFKYEDANSNKFRRLVLKASRFPVYSHHIYTSKNKNKWLILLEARSKKETGDLSRITNVAVFDSPHGFYSVMVSFMEGKPQLIFFPPHFFSRFRERIDFDVSGIDLMLRFFRHNASFVFSVKDILLSETSKITEIYGSCKEGVALGLVSTENNILFKTFVTYDMLKGEQVETFTENERIRKEIHEA